MGGLTERQVAGNTRAEVLGWPLPCPEWWIDNYEPQKCKTKQQHVNWYKLRARLLVRLSEGFVLVAGVVLVGSCVPSVWSARALRLECSVRGLVRVPSVWSVVVRGLPLELSGTALRLECRAGSCSRALRLECSRAESPLVCVCMPWCVFACPVPSPTRSRPVILRPPPN